MVTAPISDIVGDHGRRVARPRPASTPILRAAAADRLRAADAKCHDWLIAHSIGLLRVSIGIVFLAFGILKFFPGISPAQGLVEKTTDILLLGLVPGPVALVLVASLESIIGVCLIAGRPMRLAVYLLLAQLVGVLSPLVLIPGTLFAGPHSAPTLAGQYVLKDIVLAAAGLVLAATLRGGHLTSDPVSGPAPSNVYHHTTKESRR